MLGVAGSRHGRRSKGVGFSQGTLTPTLSQRERAKASGPLSPWERVGVRVRMFERRRVPMRSWRRGSRCGGNFVGGFGQIGDVELFDAAVEARAGDREQVGSAGFVLAGTLQ